MLRDFPVTVCERAMRIATALFVASIALALTACGIKGPLRPATPTTPPATDVGPPAPAPPPAPPVPANQ